MGKLVSTSTYIIESIANIVLDGVNIFLKSKDTYISGNLIVDGHFQSNSCEKKSVEQFNIITSNIISTNSFIINGNVMSNLIVDKIIQSNTINTNQINTNQMNSNLMNTNQINMPNGVINIPNGIINGPVQIFGLQVVNVPVVSANIINFRSSDAKSGTFDFNIENIDTPPPEEKCSMSWIKVKINGASFYIFAQKCED